MKIVPILLVLCLFGLSLVVKPSVAYKPPADFPYVTPFLFLNLGDSILWWEHVPLQNRYVTLVSGAAYDAQTLYHPSAAPYFVGSNLRRPANEHNEENRNVAVAYAAYNVAVSLLPSAKADYDNLMRSLELDPSDSSRDPTTPVGLGNIIADAVRERMYTDGANQLGDMNREFNRHNYSDYTGYAPVNTFDHINDASRWQPLLTDDSGSGLYRVQQHITPHWPHTKPFAHPDPNSVVPYSPRFSPSTDLSGFHAELQIVLDASRNLNEEQKLISEFYEEKVISYGTILIHLMGKKGLSGLEFSAFDFGLHMAISDAAISCWNAKLRYDYIRPVSAIHYFYGDRTIQAHAMNEGIKEMKASEWSPYLKTAAHSEHPSGSSCFCSAAFEFSRRFFGSDELDLTIPHPKGSSFREPGVTPAQDTSIYFSTFTEAERLCGQSRLWGGVHYSDSIISAQKECRKFGAAAYDKMVSMLGYDLSADRVPMPPGTPAEIPEFLKMYPTYPGAEGDDDRDDGDDHDDGHDSDDDDDDDDDRRDCPKGRAGRDCRRDRGKGKDKGKGRRW